ncbi:MAG TPA: hypothetical protein VNW15_16055 [Rhizomicrobium sp.]|jgi:hypothetical protein|nr:hypothetical protein [Rhizomicrobium sp.]
MSQPRYASITASLLARKGDAQPWAELAKRPLAWDRGELPVAPAPAVGFFKSPPPQHANEPEPAHAHHPADLKKISVRMSHHDYERLGILAVKQDKTRQRLLHEALDRLLAGITQKYSASCACLGEERFAHCERCAARS